MKYIDLGLPSKTLWADENKEGFYTFNAAVAEYGNSLPTRDQWEELKDHCKWEWVGKGYRVTGLNGNSIFLPAEGWRDYNERVYYVGSCCCYLSSTPRDLNCSWSLNAFSDSVFIGDLDRCYSGTVRLIKKHEG